MSLRTSQSQIFHAAYEEYNDAIFRFCLTRLRNRDHAIDITQSTFMKVWEYLQTNAPVKNMRALLYHVARNLIIDDLRKKSEVSLDALIDEGGDIGSDDPAIAIERNAEMKRAMAAIDQLNDGYRELIIMRYIDGLAVQEIGKLLDIPPNTVSVRLKRAIKQAQDIFNTTQL